MIRETVILPYRKQGKFYCVYYIIECGSFYRSVRIGLEYIIHAESSNSLPTQPALIWFIVVSGVSK